MNTRQNNYAFIDSQNLNLGIQELGWKLSYKKFRVYLLEKYHVQKAYVFIGFVASNQRLYDSLEGAGFILKSKPVTRGFDGKLKGNMDADLVLQAMIDFPIYEKATIVSSDGDFYSLVQHLYSQEKLEAVISSDPHNCSGLLKQAAKDKIQFLYDLREKLEYINEKAPFKDETLNSAFS